MNNRISNFNIILYCEVLFTSITNTTIRYYKSCCKMYFCLWTYIPPLSINLKSEYGKSLYINILLLFLVREIYISIYIYLPVYALILLFLISVINISATIRCCDTKQRIDIDLHYIIIPTRVIL